MTQQHSPDAHADEFAAHRRELIGAAYRILGSVSDAEDVVQETWLRWADVELAGIRNPRAYLLQATTRQALNHLRHQQRLRESYIGPWLPEPVSDTMAPDTAAETADAVSLAMLVVLETLSPLERATFILREVFGLTFDEIADALDRTPASVRQLAHRSREHVRARAPRHPVDPATHDEVTERFLAAVEGGSIAELMEMMAPDVVLIGDGGGIRRSALHPIRTPEKVVRFGLGALGKVGAPLSFSIEAIGGEQAIVMRGADGVDSVLTLMIDGDLITEIYFVRNPEKLTRV